MTPRLVGVVFYSNLLPAGRAIEASTSIRTGSSGRRTGSWSSGDAAVWTQRQQEAQWDGDGYLLDAQKQLPSNTDTLAASAGMFSSSAADAASQYELYARILAAPAYPSFSLYA